MSELVRSGWVAANIAAMVPPSPTPRIAARSEPAASITARTSSIHSSSGGSEPGGAGSDRPMPSLSKEIKRLKKLKRRKNRASDGMSGLPSRWKNHSETNTRSISPSPRTWYAT
jgi:hypothetical protein